MELLPKNEVLSELDNTLKVHNKVLLSAPTRYVIMHGFESLNIDNRIVTSVSVSRALLSSLLVCCPLDIEFYTEYEDVASGNIGSIWGAEIVTNDLLENDAVLFGSDEPKKDEYSYYKKVFLEKVTDKEITDALAAFMSSREHVRNNLSAGICNLEDTVKGLRLIARIDNKIETLRLVCEYHYLARRTER